MIVVAAGLGLLAFLVWLGRGDKRMRLDLRLAAAFFAAAAAVGAVVAGLRGGWPEALILVGLSAYLGRRASVRDRDKPQAVREDLMTPHMARSILGVGQGAGRAEVEEAYRRLIQRAHPDHGGSSGLAAQLNLARECLLGR